MIIMTEFTEFHSMDEKEIPSETSRKRLLYVLHYSGGVEHGVKDIANSVSDEFDFLILRSDMSKLILSQIRGNEFITLEEFELTNPWNAQLLHSEEYKEIYSNILSNYRIDLIQMNHMLFHTLDLPDIANEYEIPIILSLHDYYYICPIFVLLDENYVYCGGYCDNKDKKCSLIMDWFGLPENIVEWKEKWQNEMKTLFEKFDMIITAMPFTKNMYLEHYPSLKETDIKLMEYGRDIKRYYDLNDLPDPNKPIKILIPGAQLPHKGSLFIKELKELDSDNRLELHFLGFASEGLNDIGISYGEYEREDFAKYVAKISPSFTGIFSIWPETYCHTLTESISVGVPVIASGLGSVKDRVERSDCGWLIDTTDVEGSYQRILEIAGDRAEYERVKSQIDNLKLRTSADMGEEYKELYQKLLNMEK